MPSKKVPVRTKKPRPRATNDHAGTTGFLPDFSSLDIRLPISRLRSIRLQAALGAKTLDDFVREAIEDRLRG